MTNIVHRSQTALCSTQNTNYSPPPLAIQNDIVGSREVIIPTNYKLPSQCSRDITLTFAIPRSNLFMLPIRTYLRVRLSVRKST